MSGFEHYAANAREIETEILRKGIALGIDWDDPAAVRALAHEAIDHLEHAVDTAASTPVDYQLLAKVDLFGLAGLMLKEPVAWGGPIVMNTKEELDLAFQELENNTFVK